MRKKKSKTSAMASTAPRRMANQAMKHVRRSLKRTVIDFSNPYPKNGSLFLVTRANGDSIGMTSSLAIDCKSRGALQRHWRAAPTVDRKDPIMTSHGEGHDNEATTRWLSRLLPFLKAVESYYTTNFFC